MTKITEMFLSLSFFLLWQLASLIWSHFTHLRINYFMMKILTGLLKVNDNNLFLSTKFHTLYSKLFLIYNNSLQV